MQAPSTSLINLFQAQNADLELIPKQALLRTLTRWDRMVACPQHNPELGLCTSPTSDTDGQTLLLSQDSC